MQGKTKQPTDKVSSAGRPIWEDEEGGFYSELTVTFPFNGKWVTFPSVDSLGNVLSEEEVEAYVRDNGPVDPITGEVFPFFNSLEEAESFARKRSESLSGFNTGGVVTLGSVPGFQRPMSAGPNDEFVAEDEFGRRIYKTPLGQRYTLSVNPDQRTARTRFEEDLLPEMQAYLENPTLPTASQAAGFVGDVARGAYESLESAVQGRGTLGDVAGLAVGSGVGSMFGEVPEGSLRLFGGFRAARHPGQDAEGRELPTSIGFDDLRRFEIDDSLADFDLNRVPQQNMPSLNNRVDLAKIEADPQNYFATLDEVLDHPELFRQYPEFRDLRIVEDVGIEKGVGGYYNDKLNVLAVSPNIARNPNLFKGVLLHEIQHAIQKVEGFDRGTNRRTAEVSEIAEPRIKEARRLYDEALENFETYDFDSTLDDVKIFVGELLDEINTDGSFEPKDVNFSTPHRTSRVQSLDVFADRLAENRVNPLDSYETLLDFYALVRNHPNLVKDIDSFESSFGVDLNRLRRSDSLSFLDVLEESDVIPIDPQRFSFLEDDIRREVYQSRSGEVEARNVQARLGLSLADRFNKTPESTEDSRYPRSEQWRVPREEPTEFNQGGVVSMEKQMSLFDMGGLTDDGTMRDPVSGNEVPPGSMASEVRDDVPAMLSEGEYIVPADVVRFYGVKFFEELRGQAKQGLMDMERNGRIGGEPVSGPGPQAEGDLSPEEMAMLAEITGMYMGGDVRTGYQAGGMVMDDPRMAQYNMASHTASIPNRSMMGFNQGGLTQQDFMNKAQQASGFQLPPSVFAPSQPTQTGAAPFTPVTLYGPDGNPMVATTQEQYNQLLAQGYTTQLPTVPVAVTESGGGGGGGGFDDLEAAGGGFRLSDENLESIRNNPLAFGKEALESGLPFTSRQIAGAGGLLGGPAGMVAGGLAGAAMELDNVAKARAALEVAKSQKLEGTPEFEAFEKSLRTAESNLGGPARMLDRLGFGSGNSYLNQVRESTPAPAAPTAARVPTGGGGGSSSERFETQTPKEERDSGLAPDTSPRPTARPSSSQLSPAGQTSKAAALDASGSRNAPPGADRDPRAVGPMNKGGLVAKPARKKPVAKKK